MCVWRGGAAGERELLIIASSPALALQLAAMQPAADRLLSARRRCGARPRAKQGWLIPPGAHLQRLVVVLAAGPTCGGDQRQHGQEGSKTRCRPKKRVRDGSTGALRRWWCMWQCMRWHGHRQWARSLPPVQVACDVQLSSRMRMRREETSRCHAGRVYWAHHAVTHPCRAARAHGRLHGGGLTSRGHCSRLHRARWWPRTHLGRTAGRSQAM